MLVRKTASKLPRPRRTRTGTTFVTVQQGAQGTSKQGQQQDQTSNCRPGELNLTTGCSLALVAGSGGNKEGYQLRRSCRRERQRGSKARIAGGRAQRGLKLLIACEGFRRRTAQFERLRRSLRGLLIACRRLPAPHCAVRKAAERRPSGAEGRAVEDVVALLSFHG
jgi:hypothetical protein